MQEFNESLRMAKAVGAPQLRNLLQTLNSDCCIFRSLYGSAYGIVSMRTSVGYHDVEVLSLKRNFYSRSFTAPDSS